MATSKILRTFRVDDSADVQLTIRFGFAAIGASTVWLGDVQIDDPATRGKIENLPIGKADDIRGKQLRILTLASEFDPDGKKTSIVYDLTNGTPDKPLENFLEADDEGGDVDYKAGITFE